MDPSTSLYQIKVSCPYYSQELVLTFSSYGSLLLDYWLDNPSMRSGLRYSTNTSTPRALFFLPLLLLSVCSSCSGPSLEPFVNINLNPSLTEPEELLYQSIQHLLVCIQLSPYDSLSVLNLLSSLLYETGDIDFFYTYSIYTSIFDILNITEESIATYMDQHPNSRNFPPFFHCSRTFFLWTLFGSWIVWVDSTEGYFCIISSILFLLFLMPSSPAMRAIWMCSWWRKTLSVAFIPWLRPPRTPPSFFPLYTSCIPLPFLSLGS